MSRRLRSSTSLQVSLNPTDRVRNGLQILLLILTAVLIYANTFQSPFILDDHTNIVENLSVRLVDVTFENLARAAFENPIKTRPVAYLSFALNYYVHGYDLPGYHLINLLIHILNGLFLYVLLKTTLTVLSDPSREGCRVPSAQTTQWMPFTTAMIWLVHPLHTQSVTYIVQRMNSLATLFYIAAVWFYAQARVTRKQSTRNILYAGTFLAAVLALGSKEIAVMLPLTLFLYEWFFLQGLDGAWLRKRIPIAAALFCLMALVAFVLMDSNPLEFIRGTYKWRDFTLMQRVLTEFRVVIYYLSLLIYPHPGRLNLEHDFLLSQSLVNPATTLLSMLAIAGMIAGAIVISRKNRLLSFCILCFFSNLVIESSILGLEIIFEHRTYLPSMFAVTAFALFLHKYLPQRAIRIVFVCAIVFVFSRWTYDRNQVWQNEVVFFTDCLAKSPEKWRVHANLGNALSAESRFDEALLHFNEALKLNFYSDPVPHSARSQTHQAAALGPAARRLYANMLSNMGNALVRKGSLDEAVTYLKRALAQEPGHAKAHVNMGLALSGLGQAEAAIGYYRKALELDPDEAKAHNNLGLELAALGNGSAAIDSFNRAIALDPTIAEAYNNRGVELARQGRKTEALRSLSKAIGLRPDYTEAYYNLGMALMSLGKLEESGTIFRQALTLQPDYEPARKGYAAVTARQQQYANEKKYLQGAIADDPHNPEPHVKLGNLFKRDGNVPAAISQYEQAVEIQRDHIPALNSLGLAWATLGDYERALAIFKNIAELQPQNPDAFYKIASIYARKREAAKAVIWLEGAIERGYRDWDFILADRNLAAIRDSAAFADLRAKYPGDN